MRTPPALSKTRLSALSAALKRRKNGPGVFLVESWTTIGEALDGGWRIDIVVVQGTGDEILSHAGMVDRLNESGVEILTASAAQLRRLTATEQSQGVLAFVRTRSAGLDAILAAPPRLVLCLDAVADPGNVGTLIRTADWFGVGLVVLGKGCASLFNDKVVRSTAGSLFHVPVVEGRPLGEVQQQLKRAGYRLIGTDAAATTSYEQLAADVPVALTLGNEARGISDTIRALMDDVVAIPRTGRAESLNVSVAGAVILSRLSSRRS